MCSNLVERFKNRRKINDYTAFFFYLNIGELTNEKVQPFGSYLGAAGSGNDSALS